MSNEYPEIVCAIIVEMRPNEDGPAVTILERPARLKGKAYVHPTGRKTDLDALNTFTISQSNTIQAIGPCLPGQEDDMIKRMRAALKERASTLAVYYRKLEVLADGTPMITREKI